MYAKAFGSNVQTFLLDKLNVMENSSKEEGKKLFGMFWGIFAWSSVLARYENVPPIAYHIDAMCT